MLSDASGTFDIKIFVLLIYTDPQFHLRNARALRVNLPSFFKGPFTFDILAQKDFLLAFCLEERPVFLVTGACKFPPVARLYFLRPLAVRPPVGSLSALVIETPLDIKNVSYLKYNTLMQALNLFLFFFFYADN